MLVMLLLIGLLVSVRVISVRMQSFSVGTLCYVEAKTMSHAHDLSCEAAQHDISLVHVWHGMCIQLVQEAWLTARPNHLDESW